MLGCCCAAHEEDKAAGLVPVQAQTPLSELARNAEEEIKKEVVVTEAPKKVEKPVFILKEFDIDLNKGASGKPLGFELDPLDELTLQVVRVRPDGLLSAYNGGVDKELQLTPNDCIVEVNGVKGNTDAMVEKLKVDSKLKLSVRRLKPFEVSLDQRLGSVRSCLNRAANSRTVHIKEIAGQAVVDWNQANPELALRVHDRIIQINGLEDDGKALVDAVASSTLLKLLVIRPLP
jgi:hypothetical protein